MNKDMKNKVVLNSDYGGFGLSDIALQKLWELKHPGTSLYFYKRDGEYVPGLDKYKYVKYTPNSKSEAWALDKVILSKDYGDSFMDSIFGSHPWQDSEYVWTDTLVESRHDPDLVKVIEELGPKIASGEHASLEIIEIQGSKYRICEYDGSEWLETPDSIEWTEIE